MAETKGSSMVFVRDLVEKQGVVSAEVFYRRLTPEDAKLLKHAIPAGWYPVEVAARVLAEAARAIYPNDREGLRRIGNALALDHLNGMYRVLLKLATVPFLIQQVASLWRTYHRQGEARVESGDRPGVATLVLESYPDLPADFREMLCGYIAGSLELTRAKNVRVRHDDAKSAAWRWNAEWE